METEYVMEKWSLEDLFPGFDSDELRQAQGQLEVLTAELESSREQLVSDVDTAVFMDLLDRYERMIRWLSRVVGYGHLRFAEDTQEQQAQAYLAKAQQLAAEVENRTLFIKLWWKALDDGNAKRLMASAGDLRYWLDALRRQAPFTLSEPEERVVNLKDVNGSRALVTLYDAITNRYLFRIEVQGEVKELTRGELQVYVRSAEPALRAAAYQELLRVYKADGPILGQMYQFRLRDWFSENVSLRGYHTPIAVRNLANDVPDDVVTTLLEVCDQNASLFQRYFRLKAKWLRMDRLRRYDIYAPVVRSRRGFPFAEGVGHVLRSFQAFDPQVAELARKVLDEKHLDSEVRKGKRSGAFCGTVVPDLVPWVHTSYHGQAEDVATVAHELGHAVHSLMASHHTALTQEPSLTLAETASTFGEMLLVDELLAGNPDPELERDLLFYRMDDAYATIMRQAYFGLFERAAHARTQEGASVDDLSQLYFENLRRQFGDALDLSDDFRYEWLAIPHIMHTPFYVYAYAFGQLLVLSLYQQYRKEGDGFKPRYLQLLAGGGSDSPLNLLERARVDVRSPGFWQGGFDILDESLARLESLKLPA